MFDYCDWRAAGKKAVNLSYIDNQKTGIGTQGYWSYVF